MSGEAKGLIMIAQDSPKHSCANSELNYHTKHHSKQHTGNKSQKQKRYPETLFSGAWEAAKSITSQST